MAKPPCSCKEHNLSLLFFIHLAIVIYQDINLSLSLNINEFNFLKHEVFLQVYFFHSQELYNVKHTL